MKRIFAPDEPAPIDGLEDEEFEPNRSDFEWNFLEDYPDASPEQVEAAWQAELAEFGSSTVLAARSGFEVFPTPAQTSPASPDLRGKADWNKLLRDEGHGEIAGDERKLTNRQWNRRLRERPGQRAAESALVREAFGGEFVEGDLPLDSGGTGRKRSRTKAVKVMTAGGESRYIEIKNDRVAVAHLLGQPAEQFAPALARGRRSAEACSLRAELAVKVGGLVAAGAYQRAIADVLGCDRKTVAALEREGRLANRTV